MSSMIETHEKLSKYKELFADFQKKIPVDIFGLCKELRANVEVRDDMPSGVSGLILKKGGKCYIFCNGNEPKNRRNFTIAHELAHYLLHWDDLGDEHPENFLLRGGLSNKKETEANKLAAEILMPYSKIDGYFNERDEVSLTKMAEHFGVSKQALAIRLGIPLDA